MYQYWSESLSIFGVIVNVAVPPLVTFCGERLVSTIRVFASMVTTNVSAASPVYRRPWYAPATRRDPSALEAQHCQAAAVTPAGCASDQVAPPLEDVHTLPPSTTATM